MTKKKLTRSQYDRKMHAEAQRLIDAGQMPPLEKLLQAIAETREQYRDRILAARKPNQEAH
jgi:hypothetical protein